MNITLRFTRLLVLFSCLFLLPELLPAQSIDELYGRETLIRGNDTLPYRIMLPKNFKKGKKYPLVLFLHGAGERGNNNEAQLTHGAKLFADAQNREKYPAIVVFPQCPKDNYWAKVLFSTDKDGKREFRFTPEDAPTMPMRMLMALMQQLQDEYALNDKQLYVMGLSMGGMGTFEIVRRLPNKFAAAIPICGGGSDQNMEQMQGPTYWVFHGAKDDVVKLEHSTKMVAALRTVKPESEVKFTVYPDANHNSWDSTFAEPGLLDWLFSQRKHKSRKHG